MSGLHCIIEDTFKPPQVIENSSRIAKKYTKLGNPKDIDLVASVVVSIPIIANENNVDINSNSDSEYNMMKR